MVPLGVIRSRYHDKVVLLLLAGNFSMVTVMDYEQIIQKVQSLLELHIKQDAYIGQEPYKGDFFKVFKDAYRGGYCGRQRPRQLLTADALTDIINTRWESESDHEEERKQKVLGTLNTMWREWIYAWDHYD